MDTNFEGAMRIMAVRDNMHLGGVALDGIPDLVLEIINCNYWRSVEMLVVVSTGRGVERVPQTKLFHQFEAFVQDDYFGFNTTLQSVKDVCRNRLDVLNAIDEVTRGTPGKRANLELHEQIRQYKEQHPEATQEEIAKRFECSQQCVSQALSYYYIRDNVTDIIVNTPERGNSLSYTLRRLKQDHPEQYERVVTGEISANAAAREVGLRRATTTIYTDDAASIARTLRRKLDADTLAELIDLLQCGTLNA